jgi:hypothetical protein
VAVGAVLVELLSAWLAVGLGANKGRWTVGATGSEVGLLILATVVAVMVTIRLARVPRLASHGAQQGDAELDWLGDAVTVARRESRWLGPLRRRVLPFLDWADRTLVEHVRRHPVITAAVVSTGFGVAVFGWQGYREGYYLPATLLAMGLGFCAMFAFLVPAGSYFGLVRSANPSSGMRRRALDASVIASGAAIVTLAFRGNLWGLIGTNANAAGPTQFATLEGGAILLAFTIALSVESLVRSHTRPAR